MKIETENIRSYRLKAHHLEKKLPLSGLADAAGACGVHQRAVEQFHICI